jgi:hypothetical protein
MTEIVSYKEFKTFDPMEGDEAGPGPLTESPTVCRRLRQRSGGMFKWTATCDQLGRRNKKGRGLIGGDPGPGSLIGCEACYRADSSGVPHSPIGVTGRGICE